MAVELSMDQVFIKKLYDVLEVNLENEHFGVKEFAAEVGLSRSQLHRKLQCLEGKTVSKFIRQFRLRKAMELLQNNVATSSEIAYRVGFSSPTYFNTCFSTYFGYPPGEVKHRNHKSVEKSISQKRLIKSESSIKTKEKKNIFNRRMVFINSFAIIFLAIIFYAYYQKSNRDSVLISSDTNNSNKSIALLPFKNLSGDIENQYFADGIRDDIINQLSKIKSISVKSKQASDSFESNDLSGLEIGDLLGVDYLVIGSVQKYEDRIKIIVHLINAKSYTHLWSKDFNREFEDIFNLEREISTDIAKELNLVLSPYELEQIGKIPTENIEAYNLYLRGNHFLYKYDIHGGSLDLAQKYFNESILLDSEFALPYSGLAEVYMFKNYPGTSEDDYLKAKEYALKGIALDTNLSETHRVLGVIKFEYERDWTEAERELKIALEHGQKNVLAHLHYGRYLMYVKGDFNEGVSHAKKAMQLDPVFIYPYIIIAEGYIMMGDHELALKEANKAKEIDNKNLWASWLIFLANIEQGKDDLAIEELKRSWSLDPAIKVNLKPLLDAYETSGINGVFKWLNDWDINHAEESNLYRIAEKFAFLGEYDKAIEWLEIAYSRNSSELYKIKYDHFFKNMRTNPEFLALLKKLDFGDYSHHATFKD